MTIEKICRNSIQLIKMDEETQNGKNQSMFEQMPGKLFQTVKVYLGSTD